MVAVYAVVTARRVGASLRRFLVAAWPLSSLRPEAHGVVGARGRGVLRLGLQVRSWPALPDRTPDWHVTQ